MAIRRPSPYNCTLASASSTWSGVRRAEGCRSVTAAVLGLLSEGCGFMPHCRCQSRPHRDCQGPPSAHFERAPGAATAPEHPVRIIATAAGALAVLVIDPGQHDHLARCVKLEKQPVLLEELGPKPVLVRIAQGVALTVFGSARVLRDVVNLVTLAQVKRATDRFGHRGLVAAGQRGFDIEDRGHGVSPRKWAGWNWMVMRSHCHVRMRCREGILAPFQAHLHLDEGPIPGGIDHFFCRNLRSAAICAAITANSDWALARSRSLLAFLSASSAAALAALAFSSSRSLPRIAVSDSTVTQWGCTSRRPPATKTNSSLPSAISMRTEPGLMRVISGAWRG